MSSILITPTAWIIGAKQHLKVIQIAMLLRSITYHLSSLLAALLIAGRRCPPSANSKIMRVHQHAIEPKFLVLCQTAPKWLLLQTCILPPEHKDSLIWIEQNLHDSFSHVLSILSRSNEQNMQCPATILCSRPVGVLDLLKPKYHTA